MDRAKNIFGNPISDKDYEKAVKGAESYKKKFGDDSNVSYVLSAEQNTVLNAFGAKNLTLSGAPFKFDTSKQIIIGNIRMGFGHYRISMAMASAARALGYEPLWFDLHSFSDTTCGKVIRHQNDLYSLGSRLSQKSRAFNIFWEYENSEGFRKLTYNANDQKKAELMAPLCRALPKDIPYIATHVWPAQAAIHAGMTHVVNAIPDNWPMALHLAEGAIHTIQTPSAYLGYKALRGMSKDPLKPMPQGSLYETGHYIDHELVVNLERDCEQRLYRLEQGAPRRYLMTVGGAGAQLDLFVGMIEQLLPDIKAGKAALLMNFGDHRKVYDAICKRVKGFKELAQTHFDDYAGARSFAESAYQGKVEGIHAFYDQDIFAAVYITNLLMRCSDVLITKPSELAYYPIPKLMIRRVGGHEAWGAIRTAELGDGTYECETLPEIGAMLKLMTEDGEVLQSMCRHIVTAKAAGTYDGAYNVVKLAKNGSF